jgi:SAM-dependent methyltransferase
MSKNYKDKVKIFWNDASCGENLLLNQSDKKGYKKQADERYRLEPYIIPFANFSGFHEKKVLEIGVGLGADHQCFAEANAILSGIDLTERAVLHTSNRLKLFGLNSNLNVGDAEKLDFDDDTFDLVYSWGVIHHSPNTDAAVSEILRVLKPGGCARIMIYHKWSIVGFMLWIRYGFFSLKLLTTMTDIYSKYLESPGTKAYSIREGHELFSNFTNVKISTVLTHGDLLTSGAGQRHEGLILSIVRRLWPRKFIRRFLKSLGLFMLIDAKKP